jgi:hypothetical protein
MISDSYQESKALKEKTKDLGNKYDMSTKE